MSTETTKVLDWEPPMLPTDLIFDDGEPLETNCHRIAMNSLIRSLQQAWRDRTDNFYPNSPFPEIGSGRVLIVELWVSCKDSG